MGGGIGEGSSADLVMAGWRRGSWPTSQSLTDRRELRALFGQCLKGHFIDCIVVGPERAEDDAIAVVKLLEVLLDRPERHGTGLVGRVAEGAGADARERDGAAAVLAQEGERTAVAGGELGGGF